MNKNQTDVVGSEPLAGDGSPAPATAPSRASAGEELTWQREIIERLATAAVHEQRRARRWGIFFKFAFLVYIALIIIPHIDLSWFLPGGSDRHTALVEIVGAIGPDKAASADRVVSGLRAAFKDENTAGIVLRINSPGGSPVQSGYINDEIGRLRAKHPDIPLYAVVVDICASGGYYVAVAADKIYADKSSIVGSVGVLMNGFGFVDAMEKVGVERRLLTAGKHKGLLDPFSPTKPEESAHLQKLLDEMHRQFIDVVKAGRGDRLKGSDEELFNGYVWTGERSVALGLVDALGTTSGVARDVIGEENVINFTVRESLVDRIADRFGASLAKGFIRWSGAASDAGGLSLPQ